MFLNSRLFTENNVGDHLCLICKFIRIIKSINVEVPYTYKQVVEKFQRQKK